MDLEHSQQAADVPMPSASPSPSLGDGVEGSAQQYISAASGAANRGALIGAATVGLLAWRAGGKFGLMLGALGGIAAGWVLGSLVQGSTRVKAD